MISKEIIYDVEMLINVASNIYKNYENLSRLEINNLKNSNEYNVELKNLEDNKLIETNILKRLKLSGKINEIIDYVEEKYNLTVGIHLTAKDEEKYNLTVGIHSTAKDEENDMIKTRVSNDIHAVKIAINNEKASKEDFPSSLYILEMYTDIMKVALSIFEQNKYLIESNEKIKNKYKMALVMPTIEKELMSNNFEVNLSPYISSGLYILDESEISYTDMIKQSETISLFVIIGEEIEKIQDNIYHDKTFLSKIIFDSCILRAAFALAPIECVKSLKNNSDILMQVLKKNSNQKIAYNLFKVIFNARESDEKIPQYLSFRR